MFVPLPNSASQAPNQQQPLHLTSGEISIGRPLKKGSTVGKADILIFNEQSVSTIHAKLQVDAAVQEGDEFSHGSISITGMCRLHDLCAGGDRQHVTYKEKQSMLATRFTCGPATANSISLSCWQGRHELHGQQQYLAMSTIHAEAAS